MLCMMHKNTVTTWAQKLQNFGWNVARTKTAGNTEIRLLSQVNHDGFRSRALKMRREQQGPGWILQVDADHLSNRPIGQFNKRARRKHGHRSDEGENDVF